MLIAGIAWTGRGFDVAVLDGDGTPDARRAHVPAGRVGSLVDRLRRLASAPDGPLVCVVDSTNGMVDGHLMAAGLRVHRADPWVLPDRPALGSVDAEALARVAVTRLRDLPRLLIEGGSLTGRSEEHAGHVRRSEQATDALTAAGRCLPSAGPPTGRDKVVALTFDDGPHPPYTGRVLDALDRYAVPATFFCVGLHVSGHPDEVARMAESGHALANHTWSHPFLPDLSPRELAVQLERTDEAIAQAAGSPGAPLFRPPYGSRTPELLSWLAAEDDRTMVLWDVDARDWAMPGTDQISRAVLDQVRPGSVVLLHDGGGDRSQTADALPAVIEGLLDRGYRFARVGEMSG